MDRMAEQSDSRTKTAKSPVNNLANPANPAKLVPAKSLGTRLMRSL